MKEKEEGRHHVPQLARRNHAPAHFGRPADTLHPALPTCRGPGPPAPSRLGARGEPSSACLGFICVGVGVASQTDTTVYRAPVHICGDGVRVAASFRRRAAEPGPDQGGGGHLRCSARGQFLQEHGRSVACLPLPSNNPAPSRRAACTLEQPQAGGYRSRAFRPRQRCATLSSSALVRPGGASRTAPHHFLTACGAPSGAAAATDCRRADDCVGFASSPNKPGDRPDQTPRMM